MGFLHSCLFHLGHTYYNTWLTLPTIANRINHHTSGECFWSHFQIQHPHIFKHLTLHRWNSHDGSQTSNLASSWWKIDFIVITTYPAHPGKSLLLNIMGRKNWRVSKFLVLLPMLQLLIKSTVLLLSISSIIGNFNFNSSDIKILLVYTILLFT